MANEFTLIAEPRSEAGRGASRRLRREGKVPAIIYGGSSGATAVALDHNDLIHNLDQEAFHSQILNLKIGRKKEQVILKDVQHHPVKQEVLHIDLLRVEAGHMLQMSVPLHFAGADDSPGVKAGGVFSRHVVEVDIQCLPKNLPEYLEVDVSALEIGDSVHLSQIPLPEGVEIMALAHGDVQEHDSAVAAVHHRRVAEEEEAAEGAEAAPAGAPAAEAPAEGAKSEASKEGAAD